MRGAVEPRARRAGRRACTGGGAISHPTASNRIEAAGRLIARNASAHGGRARLELTTTRRLHAQLDAGGETGTLLIEQKRPSKIRTEITMGGKRVVRVYDGSLAWEIDSQGEVSRLSPDETGNIAREADFDGALLDYRTEGRTARYDGPSRLEGRAAEKLMLRWKDGNVSYYYLDPATALEIGEDFGRDLEGREVRFLSRFEDYRNVRGLRIAFRIDTLCEETGERQRVQVDAVELNPRIEDSRFSAAGNPAGALGAFLHGSGRIA